MKIVLVDDDHGCRKSIAMILKDLNYSVTDFSDPLEALKFIKQNETAVVLSDIRMPGMNGLELLEAVKNDEAISDTEVILFTGQSDVKDAVKTLKLGAYDYLTKPLNFEELVSTIEKAIELFKLKKENYDYKSHFNQKLEEATVHIKSDVKSLKNMLSEYMGLNHIGVFSKSLEKVFEHAQILHQNPEIPVLIQGETGTGKEVIAKFIHYGKNISPKPFIALNAATIPSELFESELFGYEGGAFTGSKSKGSKGKLSMAEDGTLFLDEITSINTHLQAKLLRVIQEKEYFSVGGLKPLTTKARFIFAANDNIAEKVNSELFRKDLYYRLKSGFIQIPPLRERKDEIIPLAEMFLFQLSKDKSKKFKSIHPSAQNLLLSYHWPGNVRELKSTIERIVILNNDYELKDIHLNFLYEDDPVQLNDKSEIINMLLTDKSFDLEDFELKIVSYALERFQGNKSKTAEFLKITRNQLYTWLQKIR